MTDRAKASSCLETGELDGWEVALAYTGEMDPAGGTRLCTTAPEDDLARVHRALVSSLSEPLSVLYRQKTDRLDPKPQGHPGRDFVSVERTKERVLQALDAAQELLYRDARCEVWVRGAMNEQVILDTDGTVYAYPDDPMFRDALRAVGVAETEDVTTLEKRDYVRHWFRAAADSEEEAFLQSLQMAEVPVQK